MERRHTRLDIWKDAMQMVNSIYELTRHFPTSEQFALVGQMRRAAISIPANIAEGAARETDKEFLRFLYIARGSLVELETHLMIAKNLGYLDSLHDWNKQTNRLFARMAIFIEKLRRDCRQVKASRI
jgi:four helix bundle protein